MNHSIPHIQCRFLLLYGFYVDVLFLNSGYSLPQIQEVHGLIIHKLFDNLNSPIKAINYQSLDALATVISDPQSQDRIKTNFNVYIGAIAQLIVKSKNNSFFDFVNNFITTFFDVFDANSLQVVLNPIVFIID